MGTKWPALRSDLLFMLSDFTGYGVLYPVFLWICYPPAQEILSPIDFIMGSDPRKINSLY